MFEPKRTVAALIGLAVIGTARHAPSAEPTSPNDRGAERQQRLQYMSRLFAEFELTPKEPAETRFRGTQQPVLRYSNPVRNFFSDGAVFLWLDGDCPVAAGTMSVRGTGKVWREFVSFSEQPLRCRRDGRVVWNPNSGNLVDDRLSDAPEPARSARLRVIQMRRLARRFRVDMSESQAELDKTKMLRLLAEPVYRWSDAESGVVDGALFAFCETTDPEAFLMLEVVRPEEETAPVWRYSLGRMTSRPLRFHLDDRDVLFLKGYWANPRSRRDPYAAAYLGMYDSPGAEQ